MGVGGFVEEFAHIRTARFTGIQGNSSVLQAIWVFEALPIMR